VIEKVEYAHRDAAGSQAQHHVAQLGDGGVGQHSLDVIHYQAHSGGKEGGESADYGDAGKHPRR
jgi:hypothetical protein